MRAFPVRMPSGTRYWTVVDGRRPRTWDISYLPDLEAYLADRLRNRERLAVFAHADGWARDEATPSDEEITRVCRLVRRIKEDLYDLTDDDRMKIQEAVALVRRSRQVVSLGVPRIR
ncbi:transposase [Streptomyces mirabilis]|uniref:transposase n=1 Tax=Streptomyces mirabilis TaxID=68239 RepID=UPI00332630FB